MRILINIEKQGTKFFSICGYDLPLLPFAGTKNLNSDTIVDFKSASLGGYSVGANEKLPEDYKAVYDRCQNKEHNHISPEGTVDLGTAIFPDSTFCFRYQVHDDTAYNDKYGSGIGNAQKNIGKIHITNKRKCLLEISQICSTSTYINLQIFQHLRTTFCCPFSVGDDILGVPNLT